MYSCDDTVRGNAKHVDLEDVLDSLLDAIDTLPQRKDSRSEPIFEPHYKLVSIVHKLVDRDILTARPTPFSPFVICIVANIFLAR